MVTKTPAQVYAGKAAAANAANISSVQDWVAKILGAGAAGTRSTAPLIVQRGPYVEGKSYEEQPRAATVKRVKKDGVEKGGFKYLFPNEAAPLETTAGGLPRIEGRLADYDTYKMLADEKGKIDTAALGGTGDTSAAVTGDPEQAAKAQEYLDNKYGASGTDKKADVSIGDIELLNPIERAERAAKAVKEKVANGEDPQTAALGEIGDVLGRSLIGDWAFQSGAGHDEAPQNVGQWIMNALSTGTYAGARAAEGVGAAVAKNQRGESDLPTAIGEGVVNALGGTARGVAEGLGARFDDQKPRTWGQNAEALGSKEALQGALGEDAGNFAQGALGTALDVGLDPSTYLTLGGSGVLKGATQGIKAGVKGAETVPGQVARGVGGAVSGALKGAAERRAFLAEQRAAAASRRTAERGARKAGGDAAYNEANAVIPGEILDGGAAGVDGELVNNLELEQPLLEAESHYPRELGPATVDDVIEESARAIPAREPAPLEAKFTPEDAKLITSGEPFDEKLLSPAARSSTGRAVWNAMEETGKLLKEKGPTGYGSDVYKATHNTILRTLSQAARRASGGTRAGILRERYTKAMSAVEAHNRAAGIFPRIAGGADGKPLYVGAADIVRALDPQVADAAFFSPLRNRISREVEQDAGFKGGFTLYPDQIGAGIQLARGGATAKEVAEFIAARHTAMWQAARKTNSRIGPNFAGTAEGKAAIAKVAANITRDDFLAKITAVNARYAPLAKALGKKAIADTMDNAFVAIAKAVTEGADRGTLLAAVDKSMEDMKKLVGESPELSAEGIGRMNHAILNGVLGEKGFKVYKRTQEGAKATGRKSEAATKKAQAAYVEAERGTEGVSLPKAAKTQDEQRMAAATVGAKHVNEDFQETVRDMFYNLPGGEEFARLVDEAGDDINLEEIGAIFDREALSRLDNDYLLSFGSAFDKLLAGVSGARGISGEALGIRAGAENSALTPISNFSAKKAMVVQEIRQRLAERSGSGTKPTLEETHAYIQNRLWHALASTDMENWTDVAALRAELAAGRTVPDATKLGGGKRFDALDEDEIDMALALREMIDHVMNPEAGGLLTRSDLTISDINDKLHPRLSDDAKDFDLKGDDIHAVAGAWRNWDQLADPLEMLDRMHTSIRLAEVPAQIGRQFSGIFGSKFDPKVANWGREDFIKNGYYRIDPLAESDSVRRFMDPTQWYSKAELSQTRYLDMYLKAAKSPNPEKALGKLVLTMDPVLHTLKSLATIWRPAHHVTNIAGEMAMNAIAGVHPLNYIRSYRALAASQGMLDTGTNELTKALGDLGFGKGIKLDPKYTSDTIRVHIKDANGSRFEEIPIQDAMKIWRVNGVAMTHATSRDLIEETVLQSGKKARALGRVVEKAEHPVGVFSAYRDNLTRIGHAIDKMEKQTYGSLDDAYAKTAAEIHDYHPTIRTLGAEEQRTWRRVFMFYTWMRQAVSRIIRTGLDRPGLVTWPAKFQYNMAEAAGLNPESIGGPTTDDPRVSPYAGNSLYGPTLKGRPVAIDMLMKAMGWTPDDEAPGLSGQDAPQDLWEYSLSTPQLDTLQTLFQGVNFDPEKGAAGYGQGLQGFAEGTISQSLNPLITGTAQVFNLAQDKREGDQTQAGLQNLLQSGGVLTAGAKILPDPSGVEANAFDAAVKGLAGTGRTEPMTTEEEQQAAEDRAKQLFNLITGAKTQNRTRPKDQEAAKKDWAARVKRELRNMGVTDGKVVDDVIEQAWEREQGRIRG